MAVKHLFHLPSLLPRSHRPFRSDPGKTHWISTSLYLARQITISLFLPWITACRAHPLLLPRRSHLRDHPWPPVSQSTSVACTALPSFKTLPLTGTRLYLKMQANGEVWKVQEM